MKKILAVAFVLVFLAVSFVFAADDLSKNKIDQLENRVKALEEKTKVIEKNNKNMEALVMEFADELALLNVKVKTLEDKAKAGGK